MRELPPARLADDEEIRALLARARTIAVVGLSANPSRPSHGVAAYLQGVGYRVIPVNPRYAGGTILGEPVVASLRDISERVDIVDIFRRPSEVLPIVRDAIAIGADAVWMQLGVVDEDAARRAGVAGLAVVMDRCTKIEHARLR